MEWRNSTFHTIYENTSLRQRGENDRGKFSIQWGRRFINFTHWSTLNFSLQHIIVKQTNDGIYQNYNLKGILKYHHIHKDNKKNTSASKKNFFFELDFYHQSMLNAFLSSLKPFHHMEYTTFRISLHPALFCVYHFSWYSGTPLIWLPMGHENLVVLTDCTFN